MVIEEQVKNPKPHLDNPNKKKFKTPAESIMVAMNGMIADKIERVKRIWKKQE